MLCAANFHFITTLCHVMSDTFKSCSNRVVLCAVLLAGDVQFLLKQPKRKGFALGKTEAMIVSWLSCPAAYFPPKDREMGFFGQQRALPKIYLNF